MVRSGIRGEIDRSKYAGQGDHLGSRVRIDSDQKAKE